MTSHLLPIALASAIPLRIAALRAKGGPDDDDYRLAIDFGHVLAEKGDRLLFRSKTDGETADLFNRLAQSIAVMSFNPGGITVFGQHYETTTTS